MIASTASLAVLGLRISVRHCSRLARRPSFPSLPLDAPSCSFSDTADDADFAAGDNADSEVSLCLGIELAFAAIPCAGPGRGFPTALWCLCCDDFATARPTEGGNDEARARFGSDSFAVPCPDEGRGRGDSDRWRFRRFEDCKVCAA